jgi:3-hydroxyisobutyrate dehydrogenase-like beta-hydroxyacid dehydrogenase
MFQYKAPRILTRNFEPGGSVDIAYKDIILVSTLARELGVPLFLPNVACEIFQTARAMGLRKKDSISIINLFEYFFGPK